MVKIVHGCELGDEIRNECIAAFEMFTAETTDGLLGAIELDKVLRMLGQEPSAQELKSVMDEFALSDNGKMSVDDFLDLMERQLLSTMKSEDDLEKNFRKLLADSFYWFDKDRDGVLNKKELQTAFALIGENMAENEFEDFFHDCDRNGDGKVDYEEWIKMMLELEGEIKC